MRPPRRARRVLLAALCLLMPCAGGARATEPPLPARFFFSGDGVLALDHAHFAERLHVRFRDAAGQYDPAALARVTRFFRSRSDGQTGPISLRLIELIDFFEDRYRPAALTLVSGYRSPELNADLRGKGRRVAQASLHTEGLAADLHPAGLDLRRVWHDLRALKVGGVGLYARDGFLHLDTGRPRFWEPATAGVEQNLSAGNARMFARTEFDRYEDLRGAIVTLHGVTALPLRIERRARMGGAELILAPGDAAITEEGGCLVIAHPAAAYPLIVTTALAPPPDRTAIRLHSCAPRIEATPAEIETNPIAALATR